MLIWIAIMVLAVFLDQITKYLTVLCLKPMGTLPIIEDVLHLTYVENTGAAFGMMKDMRWVFMIVSSVAIVALLIYLFKKKSTSKLENWAIALIVGGGVGNMIDRVILGYVIDMIDFRLINFAVFNVADTFVCIGAGLLMLHIILLGVNEYKAEKAKKLALVEGDEEETPEDPDETVMRDSDPAIVGTVEEVASEDCSADEETAPDDATPEDSNEDSNEDEAHE